MKADRATIKHYKDDQNFDECSIVLAAHVILYSLLYFLCH
jgi:hypothetical protein